MSNNEKLTTWDYPLSIQHLFPISGAAVHTLTDKFHSMAGTIFFKCWHLNIPLLY